jgi:CRISPR-associated endonuclease Csn1
MPGTTSFETFRNGLVFGFDLGTGSIGWAVRRGSEFLDVGVLICPEETTKLDSRRSLRRQRRTLRSKKYRRRWFARELAALLGLKLVQHNGQELPLPDTAWGLNANGGWVPKPGFESLRDPVSLRVAAAAGRPLRAEELFTALTHLFRRRGYLPDVPWRNRETESKDADAKKEEGEIRSRMFDLEKEMQTNGCRLPCQLLALRARNGLRQRKEIWPRKLVETEFRAIVAAQADRYPPLAQKADWLLYGDTRQVKGHPVYFKATESRNPGVLGLKWPRFDNRGPALDVQRPVDEQGRPQHVVRKNKQAFQQAQWELAVMNFRVIDRNTGALTAPAPQALARLREIWESSRRRRKSKASGTAYALGPVEIKPSILQKWEQEFASQYKLVNGQQPLTPQTGAGRARYSSPTLKMIREQLARGVRFDPPQPVLIRPGESQQRALERYLADIKHPLVRHRLLLFSRLLQKLVKSHGEPDLIVLEAVRSLALGEKKKRELIKRNKENRDEREAIRQELASRQASTSRNAILRYRLWKEARSTCPFCGDKITQEQLLSGEADIEHLVPRSVVDCNEFYNLTIGHVRCNREIKGDRTPFQAFGHTDKWPQLRDNAVNCFRGRKLEIFLSDKAEELIEQKADLQHTAYIARVVRHVALIQLGWTDENGRDPTIVKGNRPSSSFQVTNGQLTSRLRQAWGLNQILHPLPEGKRWDDLTDAERERWQQKNRGDLRHHALDAMVIACTLPWLAHRTVGATDPETGEHGWWQLDERTRRSLAINPVFPGEGQMRRVVEEWMQKAAVHHHVSRSPHQRAYETTIYGKKAPNTYVARKVFSTLKPKNLASIWPPKFAAYCQAAWTRYEAESPDIEAELKRTKDCLPEAFTNRLCFAHFQQWRERDKRGDNVEFTWPKTVKIPIRSVKWIGVKDDYAVAPASPGTKGFVARGGRSPFREVQVHVSADGKSLVPVFIPSWRGDAPIAKAPIAKCGQAVATIRRGQIVEIKNSPGPNTPCGVYRVASTMQKNIQLIPTHLADRKETLKAAGYLENGVNISWETFLQAAGYELPRPPSAQPASPGAGEVGPAPH